MFLVKQKVDSKNTYISSNLSEFYFMGNVTPIDESFEETMMKDDNGNDVSVVKLDFKMNITVEDGIYAYLTSVYMNEIMRNSNPNIQNSFLTHGIIEVDKLLAGDFDNDFFRFLKSRYESIKPYFQTLKTASNNLNTGVNSNIWT